MTYFQVLPFDLTSELSLYLDYRDTCIACEFLKCTNVDLWLNKLRKELKLSNEFISQYVYDSNIKIMRTLLPINEKYLELKARKSVDFGAEFYQYIANLLSRSARLTNFQLAIELVKYFLTMYQYISLDAPVDQLLLSIRYKNMLRNALSVGNIDLSKFAYRKLFEIPQIHRGDYKQGIVEGIYANNPKPDQTLFKQFKIKDTQVKPRNVQIGLAMGGYLKELLELNPQNITFSLWTAVERGHKNIIDYFNLLSITSNLATLIESGYVELLPPMESLTDIQRIKVMSNLIKHGYVELIERNIKYLTNAIIETSIRSCIFNNHLDTLHYLYTNFQVEVILAIKKHVDIKTFKLDHLTPYTLEYLVNNKLIDIRELSLNRLENKLNIMNQYNPDAYEYLLSITQYRHFS